MEELKQLRLSVRTSRPRDDTAVIAVAGECDLYEAPLLEAALAEAGAAPETCVYVDLSELRFLDSTGVHVLLKAQGSLEAARCELVLVAPTAEVRRTLAVAGLDGRFPVRERLDDLDLGATEAPPDERELSPSESLFRSVNARILEISSGWGGDELHFFCECRDGTCTKPVSMSRETYERIRAVPGSLVVSAAHAHMDGWEVVERSDGYVVVRGRGAGVGGNMRGEPVDV